MAYPVTENFSEYIRITLPDCPDASDSACGEELWVLVTPETKAYIDDNNCFNIYTGILESDSTCYPALKSGTRIIFTMNEQNQPSVTFDFLNKYRISNANVI